MAKTKLERVREFHRAMGIPAHYCNTLLDRDALNRRYNLITEEANELYDAEDDPTGQLDALVDLLYVVLGTAVEMGLREDQLEEAFSRVHASNMAKLGPDGKVIYREDGKVLKPEGWKPPVLDGIFEVQ